MTIHYKFARHSPKDCLDAFTVVTWFIVLGTIVSEIILMLRTYAIWERKRFVLIILSSLIVVVFPAAVIITHLEVKSLVYILPIDQTETGCHLAHAKPLILVAYVFLVLTETAMAVLTAVRAYVLRRSHSRWVMQLHQDGLLFYFYMLLISIANIIVPIIAPPVFSNWLPVPQHVIHSTCCNRVLFLILQQRSASSMTNRLPGDRGIVRSGSSASRTYPTFTDGAEEIETSASFHIGMTRSVVAEELDIDRELSQEGAGSAEDGEIWTRRSRTIVR